MAEKDKFRRDLRAGERLFHEGDPGDCAFLVEAGVIDVKRKKDATVIGTVRAGDLLGEMALLDGRPRSAGAVAREASSVRVITRANLKERLQQTDPLLRYLLHVILDRYRAAMGGSGDSVVDADQDALKADREEALQRLRRVSEIEGALSRRELTLRYQPIVRLSDGVTVGFQAQLEWKDGSVRELAAAIRDSAVAEEVGRWALLEACAGLQRIAEGAKPAAALFAAVPVAGRHVVGEGFARDVTEALRLSGVPAAQLMLQLPEADFMRNPEAISRALASLRSSGVRAVLIDFGVGESSLTQLHAFPPDGLQPHRSFVTGLAPGGRDAEILKVLAALAHALRVPVIVDGVETQGQGRFVNRYGFEFALGPLFSAGVPESEAAALAGRKWSAEKLPG